MSDSYLKDLFINEAKPALNRHSGGGNDEYIAALPKPTISLTWSELKQLRDSAQLTPGQFYRIVDYNTTTTQSGSKAAGHQFDIIVQALTTNELSEHASADYHEGDTYFTIQTYVTEPTLKPNAVRAMYTIYDDPESSERGDGVPGEYGVDDKVFSSFSYLSNDEGVVVPVIKDNGGGWSVGDPLDPYYYVGTQVVDNVIYDKWRKIEKGGDDYDWDSTAKMYVLTNVIVENGKFTDSVILSVGETGVKKVANLHAWQLKYCLDNDTNRFSWADVTNGTGVIYWMRDEWDNECPYDFKNILFERTADWQNEKDAYLGELYDFEIGSVTWFYTFSLVHTGHNVDDLTLRQDLVNLSNKKLTNHSNRMGIIYDNGLQRLNGNVLIHDYRGPAHWNGCYNNNIACGCYDATLICPKCVTYVNNYTREYILNSDYGGIELHG